MAHWEQDEKTGKLLWIRDEEDTKTWDRDLGKRGDKVGNTVYEGWHSLVPESYRDTTLGGVAGMVSDFVGSIGGAAVSAATNAPRLVHDLVDSAYYDNVGWGGDKLKEDAQKNIKEGKTDNMSGVEKVANWASGWIKAIDDNRNTNEDGSSNVAAETAYEMLNWPTSFGIGKIPKAGSTLLRRVGKIDDLLRAGSKVENVADDVAKNTNRLTDIVSNSNKAIGNALEGGANDLETMLKVNGKNVPINDLDTMLKNAGKSTAPINDLDTMLKNAGKTAGAIDDVTKTISTSAKPSILEKVSAIGKQALTKAKNGVSSLFSGTGKFFLGPVKAAWDIGANGYKVAKNTYKTAGIGSAVMKGITETTASALDFASDFFDKPLAFRTPAIWEANTSNLILGDIAARNVQSYIDDKQFLENYGYDLRDVQMKNNDELEEWYNAKNIPSDKRLTAEELKDVRENLGNNKISNLTEGYAQALTLFDVFSTPAQFQALQRDEDIEVKKNSRGETINIVTLEDGTIIDNDNGTITDKDGNPINPEDLTDEQVKEFVEKSMDTIDREGSGVPTGDDEENPMINTINGWMQNGMLTADSMKAIVEGENTRGHFDSIAFEINEASKQYTSKIVALYTPDQIANDPQLQKEITQSLTAMSNLFNNLADVINEMDANQYNTDTYYFREALSQARDRLSQSDKDLIDGNLYQRAIDYNNTLESGRFERGYAQAGTIWKRFVDDIWGTLKSDDREYWYDQGLAGFGAMTVNPEIKDWGTMFNQISTSAEDNAAYLTTMMIGNKINEGLIEKYTEKGINTLLKNNPKWNTKFANGAKGFVTEAISEPMENFMDLITTIDSPDHDNKYWQGLIFGAIQGGIAGYAGANSSYNSIQEYYSDSRNRKDILENMGIYIDQIQNPEQKAAALALTNQLFDNVVGIMAEVAGKTNNGVESLMQGYAIYQIENLAAEYTSDVIGQAVDYIAGVVQQNRDQGLEGDLTREQILDIFASERDFQNYNAGKGFRFNNSFIERLNTANADKLNTLRNTATAYINSSFQVTGKSLEEGINFMAPKIYESGGKVNTTLFNKKVSDNETIDSLTGNPYHDMVTIYANTQQVVPTIGERVGITRQNSKVYGKHKRIAELGGVRLRYNSFLKIQTETEGYKPTVTVDRVDAAGNTYTEELSMKDYIIDLLNNSESLTSEEKRFISTILFKSTVSGLNPYFKDDGSLTKLGEDFFDQVMPQVQSHGSALKFMVKMRQLQTYKEIQVEKSERDALRQSQANDVEIEGARLEGGETLKSGDDLTQIDNSKELMVVDKESGKNITIGELKESGVIEAKEGNTLVTYAVIEDGDKQILTIEKDDGADIETAYEVKAGGTTTVTITDNNPATRQVNIPVSADANDYPELKEGVYTNAEDLVKAYDIAKRGIPFMDQSKVTVGIEVDNSIETLEADNEDIHKPSNDINKKEYWSKLPDVEIMVNDGTDTLKPKKYKAVWIGDSAITDKQNKQQGKTKNFIYKSFVLVDFAGGEKVKKYTSKVLRPTLEKKNKVYYRDNNIVIDVLDSNNNLIDENRILMFTKGDKKGTDKTVWRLASTIQLDRLGKHNRDKALDGKKVFMNEWFDPNNTMKTGYLGQTRITYDPRQIYTTSDVVFGDNNEIIRIAGMSINIKDKKYNGEGLSGQGNNMMNIKTLLNKIWEKGQSVQSDGTLITAKLKTEAAEAIAEVVEDIEPIVHTQEKTPAEIKKQLNEIDVKVEAQYNYGVQKAESREAPVTESIAESAVKNTQSIQVEQQSESSEGINTPITEEEQTVLEATTVENLPEPTELIMETLISNEEIASRHLSDPASIDQLAKDCKALGIALDSLDAEELLVVIEAYSQGKGIDYVIEQFAAKLPTAKVDKKLVQLFIDKGVLRKDVDYDGLTISQMINYTAVLNENKKEAVYKMVNADDIVKYGSARIINGISDYYIRNYFHYNPENVTYEFKRKIRELIKKKLLDSDIFIAEEGNESLNKGNELSDYDELSTVLKLEKENPELRKAFATAAYLGPVDKDGNYSRNWKPLISQSKYNYLMGSNPYIANINNGDYNPGIIASSLLETINSIPEFGGITSKTADENKLDLLVSIYNYFQILKSSSSYEGLIRYLNKKYSNASEEMKGMVEILAEDMEATMTPIHSDTTMNLFRGMTTPYEGSPYELFVKDKYNSTDAIIEALIVEERLDPESFNQIIPYVPAEIRQPIYRRFFQENRENHGKNIAYGLVSSMITNNNEVQQGLQREHANAGFGDLSDDALYILRNFDRRALISPVITQQLQKELGLPKLDTTKGTVILTNNGQNSLGMGMKNFQNTKGFQMLSVSNLNSVQLNVNVIVPYGVSIPKDAKDNFNIIRVNQAGYYNGALVIKTYDGSEYDMNRRTINILGMTGIGIQYGDMNEVNLTDNQKATILSNKQNKALYWNIFRYNILPNLGDEVQDITQEKFEKMIDDTKLSKVKDNALFNSFVAKDINDLVDASVRVINFVTNSEMGLQSNKEGGRHGLMLNKAINNFASFVADTFDTSSQREAALQMYADYLMAQLAIGDFDKATWFHNFCENHPEAISALAEVYKDRSQQGNGLADLFINQDNTSIVRDTANRGNKLNEQLEQKIHELSEVKKQIKELQDGLEASTNPDYVRLQITELESKENTIQTRIDDINKNLKEIEGKVFVQEGSIDNNILQLEDAQAMQEGQIDIEQAENSSVLTQAYETNGAYEDKAVKVLSAIYQDYIAPNMTSEGDVDNDRIRGVRLVSKNLMNIVTGEGTFSTQNINLRDITEQGNNENMAGEYAYSDNRRLDISNKDLITLQGILVTLKETNPDTLSKILDRIIVTQDDIGFEYDSLDNQRLKRLKQELFDAPTKFYNIMQELMSDNNLGLNVLYNVGFERSTSFKSVQMAGLLNSISEEYYRTRPLTIPSKEIGKLHEQYDKYFHIEDGNGNLLPPSDEQINAFLNLKDRFDNRSAGGTLAIPGIAGTGKTTLMTALFNYIMEVGGAPQEVTNIKSGKQKAFILNFNKADSEKLWEIKGDNRDHYMKIENDKSGESVYIKFKGSAIVSHQELEDSYKKDPEKFLNKLSGIYGGMWNADGLKALADVGEDNFVSDYSKFTMMIKNFEVVNKTDIPTGINLVTTVPGKQGILKPRLGQSFKPIKNNAQGLNNVSFAVRMHSTAGSLKDVFVDQGGLVGLDISTLDSYLEQDDATLMTDIGYSTSYHIKPGKQVEGKIIIIDEAQNSYNTHLKALVDGLSEKNSIVFLGDYHQTSKGDYLKNMGGDLYMTETHRGTEDINIINDISSFIQESLAKANAIGIYMKDSEDFIQYNNEDIATLIPKDIRKTLMVCHKNSNRQNMNDLYLKELGGINNIITKGTPVQAMIVDIESDEKSQRSRKSELLNEGLNLKGYHKAKSGDWYYKITKATKAGKKDSIEVFFPSTITTDTSDIVIKAALKEMHKKGFGDLGNGKRGGDITMYVPAFAITTEKESGKTVDNIILHSDVTNTEYDYLSEKAVQRYYDAFTRGAKKVYIPANSTRLIGITKEQAIALRDGNGLTEATIPAPENTATLDMVNIPSINNGKWNSSYVLDDMISFINNIVKEMDITGSDSAIKELGELSSIMTSLFLQSGETTADREVQDKFGTGRNIPSIARYQWQLQRRAAEIWDGIYNRINKKNLYNKISEKENAESLLNTLRRINGKVYGQTIKTPYISRKGKDNGRQLLYGQKKYINKKMDLELVNDIAMQSALIGQGSLTEGVLLVPTTKQDADGKFYTILSKAKVDWITKEKFGWLNQTYDETNSALLDKRLNEYDNIFKQYQEANTIEGKRNALDSLWDRLDEDYNRLTDDNYYTDVSGNLDANEDLRDNGLQIRYDNLIYLIQDARDELPTGDDEELDNYEGLDDSFLNDISAFVSTVHNIDKGYTTANMEDYMNEFDAGISINTESMQNSIDSEFTCNG